MDYREPIISQYHAALDMLKQSILACPDTLWDRPDDRTTFAQVAYHALFFTHLYLQESEHAFRIWSGHRDAYRFEDDVRTQPAESAPKATVLAYLAFCQHHVVENVSTMEFDAASGFDWLPFTKFELQLYSIRHIQQHVGELIERLGARASAIDWVGAYRDERAVEKHT
jgi:hypothetical protein